MSRSGRIAQRETEQWGEPDQRERDHRIFIARRSHGEAGDGGAIQSGGGTEAARREVPYGHVAVRFVCTRRRTPTHGANPASARAVGEAGVAKLKAG
jgi:hypothetical protein